MAYRIHTPDFPEDFALYIIWAERPGRRQTTVAAGCLAAMDAAWSAIQDRYPDEELRLQQGALVMQRRAPIR
ncbi:hypothetical protein PARHAE_01115 [Paracoccus haematequi]|uniref:Uncharacterized protein n=1 Tax=Paracoccus haematequi TaxID=2491866 RepID=A0A447IK92_9RHOB|nr:hypothetical protein [Paracoccus haematequi]VDS07935.1 hypothetical protein PARHAE_01115 [Paracoccus haematequi]